MGDDLPAPGPGDVLTSWTVAPVADVLILLGALAYAAGVLRLRRRGHAWPAGRSVAAGLAVAGLVVGLDGALAVYAHALFWVHMLQHLVLIMVVPVLLVWAQPIRLLGEAVSDRAVTAALRHPVVRGLTHPLVALALYTAVLVLTHLTAFPGLMTTAAWAHPVEVVAYLVAGWLLFLPLAGEERTPWDVPYLLRLALMALAMGVDTLVGIALMLTGHPLADLTAMRPGWGPDAGADQSTAGGIMWVVGDGLMMVLMIVVGVRWGLARPERQTMGRWLEGARARTLLGEGDSSADTGDEDVDQDDAALARYNARLAALHGLDTPRDRDGPDRVGG